MSAVLSYKQIIIKRKIPFDLSLPKQPLAQEEMTKEQFDEMMQWILPPPMLFLFPAYLFFHILKAPSER